MIFDADSQTCDLLRRAMHAANERDDGRGLPLEAELIAEIIFLRRMNREISSLARVVTEMALGERKHDDFVLRAAQAQIERIHTDWDYAPVIDAPAEPEGEGGHLGFAMFGEVAA